MNIALVWLVPLPICLLNHGSHEFHSILELPHSLPLVRQCGKQQSTGILLSKTVGYSCLAAGIRSYQYKSYFLPKKKV